MQAADAVAGRLLAGVGAGVAVGVVAARFDVDAAVVVLGGVAAGACTFAALVLFGRVDHVTAGPPQVPEHRRPRVDVERDGSFTWTPFGEPVASGAPPAKWRRYADPFEDDVKSAGVEVLFEVPDGIPDEDLMRAVRAGTKATVRALDGKVRVRASVAVEDVPGPTSHATVTLTITGLTANERSARRGADAFGEAFRARLAR